jgi:hypothetical protein
MATYKNNEFIKVGNEENVTVSVTFTRPAGSDDATAILNAAEALEYFIYDRQNFRHKSWVKKIEVK